VAAILLRQEAEVLLMLERMRSGNCAQLVRGHVVD